MRFALLGIYNNFLTLSLPHRAKRTGSFKLGRLVAMVGREGRSKQEVVPQFDFAGLLFPYRRDSACLVHW